MYEGMPLSQLAIAEEFPQGSSIPVVMGDGSGVKRVTKETLVEEAGKNLKIGNMKELQTEDKESLVGAINEVLQSRGGGGGSVDVLETPEEIEANTEEGKSAGALAVKGMFSKLKGFEPVLDSSGKMTGYKTTVGGADTVFPFSKTCEPIGTFTASTSTQTFNVASICPDYKALTAENFMLAVSNVSINTNSGGGTSGNGTISSSIMPTITYKADTGILTLSATSIRKNSSTTNQLYTTVGLNGKIFRI